MRASAPMIWTRELWETAGLLQPALVWPWSQSSGRRFVNFVALFLMWVLRSWCIKVDNCTLIKLKYCNYSSRVFVSGRKFSHGYIQYIWQTNILYCTVTLLIAKGKGTMKPERYKIQLFRKLSVKLDCSGFIFFSQIKYKSKKKREKRETWRGT